MSQKYILIGGGGLALEIFEYMHAEALSVVAYIAPYENKTISQYIAYLGNEQSAKLDSQALYILAEGLIESRQQAINFLEEHRLPVGSFVSKYAYVSSLAVCGKGFVAIPSSNITGNPVIGDYVLCNGGSIGHDAHIGNNVVIGPGARITGACEIGSNVTLGANAALIPGTVIGANSEIGILTFPRKKVKGHKVIVSVPGVAIS